MRKKRTAVIVFCLIALSLFYYATAKKEVELIEAKTVGFASFEELDAARPIIVIGEKIEEVDTEIFRSKISGKVVGGYTKSEFLIQKILKNEYNPKIIDNKSMLVLESSFVSHEANKIYSINGYKNMKRGDKYLLFLNNEKDGLFAIRGITFGKVPLSNNGIEIQSITKEEEESNKRLFGEIFKQAREKYAE